MSTASFLVTLLDDAVMSARAASFGGHRGLPYLPGATFLGAAAARLYSNLKAEEAYVAFHSGQLRFGDALPLTADGRPTLPLPLSWHVPKEFKLAPGRLEAARVKNHLHGRPEEQGKMEQLRPERHGFVALDGGRARPRSRLRMKTAIDPAKGRAREGQLFGYTSLPAGSRYLFTLEADGGGEALFERVAAALSGELRLGRSRSAEYGRARVERLEAEPPRPVPGTFSGGLTLWLLADLAAIDRDGRPTLAPYLSELASGLPEVAPDLGRSFLRSRSYAPFNGHYRRRELERPVLTMGSVLHYPLDEAPDPEALQRLQAGAGLYR